MASAIHNFFIEQGSNFEITFEYLDENGLPITIEPDDCVRLKVKTNTNEYAAWKNGLASNNSSLHTIHSDSSLSSNQIRWTLPSSLTKLYNFDTASYALDLVLGGSPETNAIKLATGQIGLIKDLFLTECLDNNTLETCKDCVSISASSSTFNPDPLAITPTPTPSSAFFDPTITPTPTPTIGGGGGNTVQPQSENLCDYLCRGLDIFGQLYSGTGLLNINDAIVTNGSGIVQNSYSSINIANTGIAANIEVSIEGLYHQNPSDLTLFLTPPTGNKVLLSHRNKIKDYSVSSGLNFSFSNKALPGIYLYNKPSNNDIYVNILENSGINLPSPYNSTYKYSFDHLLNTSVSGNWTLNILDNDPGGTGYIKNWNIIVTYKPVIELDPNL